MSSMSNHHNVHEAALSCLMETDPTQKVVATQQLRLDWLNKQYVAVDEGEVKPLLIPGRPDKPLLVAPKQLSKRSPHTTEGKAALVHAICHIEFNAINLALDAVYRFRGLADEFYADWLQVASEEAYHFSLLAEQLENLGYQYGDFVAHNGLWEMAVETGHDVLVRMALVPRVMEARGLDATPSIMNKLQSVGDTAIVDVLKIIQADEVGHVEIGTKWYRYFCAQREVAPLETFIALVEQYMKGSIRGPFDVEMRKKAGFTAEELAYLHQVG